LAFSDTCFCKSKISDRTSPLSYIYVRKDKNVIEGYSDQAPKDVLRVSLTHFIICDSAVEIISGGSSDYQMP